MNKWTTNFILGILSSGAVSAMGYATYQLFVVIPKVEAKVEKVDRIDDKLDILDKKVTKVLIKLEIDQ